MMMVDGVGDNDYNDNTDYKKVQTFICKNTCRHTNTGRPTLRSDFQVSWRIRLAGRLMEDTKLSIGSAAGQPKPNQPTNQPTKAKIHVYLPEKPKSCKYLLCNYLLGRSNKLLRGHLRAHYMGILVRFPNPLAFGSNFPKSGGDPV